MRHPAKLFNILGHIYWRNPSWKTSFFVRCVCAVRFINVTLLLLNLWSFKSRHYISLMDVAQYLIFITSYCIYFKLLMILFWIWCCYCFSKTILVVIYIKIYIIYMFFYLSSANENLETCMQVRFEQLKKLKPFWGTSTG